MINLCAPAARCWPMLPPSISTVGWSASMSCRRGCGTRWPVFGETLGPSRSITHSAPRCHGARRRRTRPGPCTSATPIEELVTSFAQLSSGSIPDRPFLLIGQMTTADPTRSPAGTESLWAYTHVPQRVLSDAGGNLTGAWDTDEAERFADRMQDRIEQQAPGFSERIIGASHLDSDGAGAPQRESGRRLHQRREPRHLTSR